LPTFLPGSGAKQRTAIFLSVVASFQAMQLVHGTMAVKQEKPGALGEKLEGFFRLLAEGVT
jgi:hypothetical protein